MSWYGLIHIYWLYHCCLIFIVAYLRDILHCTYEKRLTKITCLGIYCFCGPSLGFCHLPWVVDLLNVHQETLGQAASPYACYFRGFMCHSNSNQTVKPESLILKKGKCKDIQILDLESCKRSVSLSGSDILHICVFW